MIIFIYLFIFLAMMTFRPVIRNKTDFEMQCAVDKTKCHSAPFDCMYYTQGFGRVQGLNAG